MRKPSCQCSSESAERLSLPPRWCVPGSGPCINDARATAADVARPSRGLAVPNRDDVRIELCMALMRRAKKHRASLWVPWPDEVRSRFGPGLAPSPWLVGVVETRGSVDGVDGQDDRPPNEKLRPLMRVAPRVARVGRRAAAERPERFEPHFPP